MLCELRVVPRPLLGGALLAALSALTVCACPAQVLASQNIAALIARLPEIAAPPTPARASAGNRQTLLQLYARRGDQLLWSESGHPGARTRGVIAALRASSDYGLPVAAYSGDALASRLEALLADRGATHEQWTAFDVALSNAAFWFVHDLHLGRVDPRAAGFDLPRPDQPFDARPWIERLAAQTDTAAVLGELEPQFLHYRLTRQSLVSYRQLAAAATPAGLPPIPKQAVKPGDAYGGAQALRRLLISLGDLPAQAGADPTPVLDANLARALKAFQFRHGLRQDGALGKSTYAALSVPLTQRVRQIELTLERWRWVPPLQPPAIIVNIPEFRLFLFRERIDRESGMLRMNVIVGRDYPKLHTPVFMAEMNAVVLRPYWDVPPSITRRELLPHLARDPRYLDAQHMELIGSDDTPLPPTAENLQALATGRLRLRQRPGPDNALGLIKFLFPNSYDVYLHSTPAQRLFDEPRRDFSHGCIRVGDPVALAAEVMRGTAGDWTEARIQAAMNGTATLRVPLAHPVQVLILYGTAVATEDGTLHFFDDLYGDDRRLEKLLRLEPVRTER
jgi:L,D-transpeptidase YcbB